jgi:hypothetical protein
MTPLEIRISIRMLYYHLLNASRVTEQDQRVPDRGNFSRADLLKREKGELERNKALVLTIFSSDNLV